MISCWQATLALGTLASALSGIPFDASKIASVAVPAGAIEEDADLMYI